MASINIDFHRLLKVFGIQDEAALKALENVSETAMISELRANAKGIIPFVLASDESFTVILHAMKRTPTTATDITGSLQMGKIEQPVDAWQKHTQTFRLRLYESYVKAGSMIDLAKEAYTTERALGNEDTMTQTTNLKKCVELSGEVVECLNELSIAHETQRLRWETLITNVSARSQDCPNVGSTTRAFRLPIKQKQRGKIESELPRPEDMGTEIACNSDFIQIRNTLSKLTALWVSIETQWKRALTSTSYNQTSGPDIILKKRMKRARLFSITAVLTLHGYCNELSTHFGEPDKWVHTGLVHPYRAQQFVMEEDELGVSRTLNRDIPGLFQFIHDVMKLESTADAVSSSRLEYLLKDFGPGSNLQTMIMRLRHLELRLALHYRELPARIFVKDVIDIEREATHCGFYADIHTGTKGGRTVALKRLRVFPTTKPRERDRLQGAFYQEILIWANLSHRHILRLIGVVQDGCPNALIPCIVMPWMQRGNVLYAIECISPSESYSLLYLSVHSWLKQIASALSYLHGENVVHGDLRGANILVNDNGEICLSDFGLSVFAECRKKKYASLRGGPESWLPPEYFEPRDFGYEDDRRPTPERDIYAFACVCIELYTGGDPFPDDTPYHIAKYVVEGNRPPRPWFHKHSEMKEDLWQIVNACWAQHPKSRPLARDMHGRIAKVVGEIEMM